MKKYIFTIALIGATTASSAQETTLVYPTSAIDATVLESPTASRIAIPPVRETSGTQDPVTPIGQIRGVLDSLKAISKGQEELSASVAELKKGALSVVAAPARSMFVDGCVVLTTLLLLIQIIWKTFSVLVAGYKTRQEERETQIAAAAYAAAEKKYNETRSK